MAGEPFAVLLGDTITKGPTPCTKQLIDVYNKYHASAISLEEVPLEKVERYGIIKGSEVEKDIYKISELVEKPPKDKAPSNLAIMGRYVLTPDIFDKIDETEPGVGGEIQLTDALQKLDSIYGVTFEGKTFKLPKAGIGEKKFVAVFDPYADIHMSKASSNDLYSKIKNAGIDKVDVVIAAEVKGAAIAQRIADLMDTELLVFRKKIKINYEDPIIAHVRTFTSGTNQLFVDRKDLEKYSGKTAIYVDDVISTGSTTTAIKEVLDKFDVNVKKYCCIFKEGDSVIDNISDNLICVDYLPIFIDK